MLLTLPEATTAVFGRTVSFDQSSRDVPSSHHHFTWRRFQGVPVTIFSALSFQRLPSTFRRTDRASTAPVSKPMMCSSLRSDFSQPDRSAPAVIEFREISGLGQLVPNRLSEYRYASCDSRPLSLEYPILPSALTAPQCLPNHGRRLSRDLHRAFSQVDAKASHQPTEFLVHVHGAIDGEEYLGRHSMTVSSLLAYCIATPSARIAGSPSMRKITFFRLHARKCSTTAETTYVAGPFSSTLIAAIMP